MYVLNSISNPRSDRANIVLCSVLLSSAKIYEYRIVHLLTKSPHHLLDHASAIHQFLSQIT